MGFIVDFVEEEDYDTLCEWWSFWRFPSPTRDMLPDNGLGGLKVSYVDGDNKKTPCCVGFLYGTNSSMCWLEFIVSNPNVKDKEIRSNSIELLISQICSRAESNGYKSVFASISNQNLINKYKKVGFVSSPTKTTELVLNLTTKKQ